MKTEVMRTLPVAWLRWAAFSIDGVASADAPPPSVGALTGSLPTVASCLASWALVCIAESSTSSPPMIVHVSSTNSQLVCCRYMKGCHMHQARST